MSQFSQLSDLVSREIQIPQALVDAFAKLRAGVDFTQNGPPDGGADGSIDEETWTAARDACVAFEALVRAVQRLDDATIPF